MLAKSADAEQEVRTVLKQVVDAAVKSDTAARDKALRMTSGAFRARKRADKGSSPSLLSH